MRARGSAKTSAHQCSVGASCDVYHGRAATTSRARSIASIRIAISGRPGSSRLKFGVGLVTTAYSRPADTPVLNEQVCGSDYDPSDERKHAGKQHEVDYKSGHLYAPRSPMCAVPRASPLQATPETWPNGDGCRPNFGNTRCICGQHGSAFRCNSASGMSEDVLILQANRRA